MEIGALLKFKNTSIIFTDVNENISECFILHIQEDKVKKPIYFFLYTLNLGFQQNIMIDKKGKRKFVCLLKKENSPFFVLFDVNCDTTATLYYYNVKIRYFSPCLTS